MGWLFALSSGYTWQNQSLHEGHFRFMKAASCIMKYGYATSFKSWVFRSGFKILYLYIYVCMYPYEYYKHPKKKIAFQVEDKFPLYYWNWIFHTAFARDRHYKVSCCIIILPEPSYVARPAHLILPLTSAWIWACIKQTHQHAKDCSCVEKA
jgi:hypothetical protein